MLLSRSPKTVNLQGVVERFWCVRDLSADQHETILPSGKAQIIFSISDVPIPTNDTLNGVQAVSAHQVFQGPTSQARDVSQIPQVGLCGVAFHAGGAGCLCGRIDEITDRVFDLSQLWGDAARNISTQIIRLGSDDARLDLLEAEISKRVGDTSGILLIQDSLKLLRAGAKIDDVSKQLGLSPYQFRKLFVRTVGFTPKRYLRIERFRDAADQLTPTSSLADVAADGRFSDQAHMTREVDYFGAMTPSRLQAIDRPYSGHVPFD